MKVLLCSFIVSLLFGISDPPAELLDKKWFFSYLRVNGQLQELPLKVPDAKRPWIYFAKDAAYRQSMDGNTENGSWSYDSANHKLTTTVQLKGVPDVTVFILERVTADSLELREPDGAVLGMVRK